MSDLRYTLLSDGSSDRALMPLLTWLLETNGVRRAIQATWADFRHLRHPPRGLPERIGQAVDLYPCDLLFVHRDAERAPLAQREAEIQRALRQTSQAVALPPTVSVVPVRMHESWLLFDEYAIRTAAGNPNGRQPLELPSIDVIEQMPDPKGALKALLRHASGLSGRHLERLRVGSQRVADLIDNFAPLRRLSAFQKLEQDVVQVVQQQQW